LQEYQIFVRELATSAKREVQQALGDSATDFDVGKLTRQNPGCDAIAYALESFRSDPEATLAAAGR
jgi:hypothetical protein